MGTSAGPSLQGIGRGGDSNLVLEMDAHDAKSYPGEPTINLIAYPHYTGATLNTAQTNVNGGWGTTTEYEIKEITGPNGTTVRAFSLKLKSIVSPFIYNTEGAPYNVTGTNSQYMALTSGTTYTASCWAKAEKLSGGSHTGSNLIYFTGAASIGASSMTVGPEWTRISSTVTPGTTGDYRLRHYFYNVAIGDKIWFTMPQVEEKGYATPSVRSQLLDFSQQGYHARPASVNLMIHGDVGSGQSFSDSSPSKHTITTVGNTTHSTAQSKFSGGSIYFDGTGDELTLASSTDWAVGTTATIDCWVYPTNAYTTNHRLWCVNNTSYNLDGYVGSDGVFKLHAGLVVSQALPRNEWTHIAVTYTSGTIKVYFNGISQTLTGTTTGYNITNTGSYQSLHIGQFISGSYYYAGYMDEFRITKGTALWTSNFTPPTRRNLSAPVVDRSSHDNGGNFATTDMTDVATYRVGEVIRPIGSAVWDFDGTDDKISMASAPSISFGESASFSVELVWSIDNYSAGTQIVFGKRSGGSSNTDYLVFYDSAGNLYWGTGTSADSGAWMSNSAYATNNQIFYGTFTLNSSGATTGIKKMYKDGEFVESANYSAKAAANSYPLEIGMDGSSYPFAGRIYLARIYNIVLTDQQVKENFNQQRNRFNI